MFASAYGQLAHRRGNNIATTAIARRLLARCFHILKQLEAAPPEKASTGRARVFACACNTAVDLTAQPGSGLTVMRTPTRARMGACQTFSATSSGPSRLMILRTTLPPARSFVQRGAPPCPRLRPGIHRRHQKPANPQPSREGGSLTPLTGPDLMGAERLVGTAVGRSLLARRCCGAHRAQSSPIACDGPCWAGDRLGL